MYLNVTHCLKLNTVLIFYCTVDFKLVLFCPDAGNRFPKTLDLNNKVLLKLNKVFVILWLLYKVGLYT